MWEYTKLEYNNFYGPNITHLNEYGAAGWELVCALTPTSNTTVLLFKRKKCPKRGK